MIQAREREAQAFELRKAGATFEQIGQRLGVTHQAAQAAVKRVLARMIPPEDVEAVRAMELARCDHIQLGHWKQATSGHVGSTGSVLKVMERRARLTGCDAPPRAPTDEQGRTVQPVTVIQVVPPGADEPNTDQAG